MTPTTKLIAERGILLNALITLLNVEGAAMLGSQEKALEGLDVKYHFDKARAAIRFCCSEEEIEDAVLK